MGHCIDLRGDYVKISPRLLATTSTLATSLFLSGIAYAAPGDPIINDGGSAKGEMVQGSRSVGSDDQKTVYTNYYTEGGAGSGGGAGLGGVFFVDQNAKLTLRNVEMLSNSVKGGEGGSVGFVSLSDLNINLPTLSINADPIQVLGVTPTISVADNGDLVITGAKMGGANSVIGVGAGVSFGTLAAGGKIATIDGSDVTFATPVTVASSAIKQAVIDTAQYSAIPTGTKGKDTLALNGSLSMSDIQQGMVVVGAGIAAGTTITDVVYDADKKVTSVKLSTAVTANVTDFKVVTVRSFDAARFQQVGSDTIKPMGVLPGLMAGMTVTGEGIPDGTTIKSVESDGTIVFSNTVAPTAGFKAGTTGAAVGSAILNLSSERSDLAVGMAVSGDGIPNGTKITAIDGNAITLSNAVTSAAAAKIEDNTFVASFGRVLSNSGNTLQLASVDGVKIGALLSGTGVPANAVVTGIDSASKTVSYRINPSAAQLSTGGAMNGLAAIGTIGSGGSNGKNGSSFNAALSNGEGQPGLSGGKAGAGRGSAGGAGGNGGSGSSGMPFNTDLNRAITALTIDAINDTAEAAASFSSWSFAMAFVKVGQVVKDWVEVGITAAQLGKWVTDLNNGTVALGGNGGVGGAGGAGDTFYGGGAGGKGGNGGSGARSYTEGGTGGDGGAGGDGGFGAGGGAGGSAGHGGRTGNAPDGADGSGGRAGFGGGVGTSGDGTGGGGGSGFGGAIFVRKGGTLLIAGDALFRNNAALSGSSNNNGVAGNAAGSDLFMMRDSNVTLSPGQGRTIRFEGSIGDDSAATYRNAAYAAGAGASLQVTGGGLVQLAGTNTYSGTTYIGGATVQATDGVGIHRDSHITFNGGGTIGTLTEENGGTWLTSGIINRRVGSLPHQISWAGSGGFAAGDDGLVLNFGALDGATGQTLNWNANGFVTAGSTLLFGSTYGTGEVKLINAVDLNGLTGRIAVYDNAAVSTDHAVLAGRFSNGSLIVNDTGYTGTAYFTAQNSLNALTVNNGLVSTKWNGTVGRMMDAVAGGALTVNGGTVDLYGAEKMTDVAVKEKGTLIARDALTARTVETSGKVRVEGAATIDTLKLTAGGQAMFAGGYTGNDIVNAGELTLSGASNIDKVTNVPGAWLVQDGALSATSHIDNAGIWALGGTLTAPVVVQNGLMLVMGTIADQVETAATRTIHTQQFSGNAGSNVGLGGLNGTTANTLVIDQSGDSQYAGIFTGAGNLAKDGTGTLTLTGHNDFTGTLKVSAGTLDTTGGGTFANSVAITVDALATLKIGTDDDIAMLKNAGITHIQAMWGMTGLENSGTLDLIGTLKVADKAANAATGAIGVAQGAKASFGQFANAGKTKVAGTLAVAGGATNDASGMIDIAAAASATFRQLANAGALDNAGTLLVSGQLHNQAGGVALLMPGASNQAGTLVNEGMIQAASALTVLGDYVQNAGSLSTTASLDTGSLSGTGGAIKLGATNRFTVIQSHDGAYAGTIGGAQASMVKQGDAVLSLTGQPGSFSVASLTVEKGGVVVTGTDS
ncbi:autotransporter-associated beta strand protein, partial [Sphingomonas sp. SORGH_AS802]|nr:autotransporter-associated beta strand protein [Sphingomonas sp. SORGH_AS_0802]